MQIADSFMMVRFTEVSLLHILIILGIPYIIFYLFERFTKFDKFIEKWEAGLFIFAFGGSITLMSIFLQKYVHLFFGVGYVLGLLLLIIFLVIIHLVNEVSSRQQVGKVGWVKIRLKNQELYKGIYAGYDQFGIQLLAGKNDKIQKEFGSEKKEVNAKRIHFNFNEILSVLYY